LSRVDGLYTQHNEAQLTFFPPVTTECSNIRATRGLLSGTYEAQRIARWLYDTFVGPSLLAVRFYTTWFLFSKIYQAFFSYSAITHT